MLVQLPQQIELLALRLAAKILGSAQIENRLADRAKQRSLISGRHEAARPVGLAADRAAALVENRHVGRQIGVLDPQAIHGPTPQRGAADERAAGIDRHQRRTMGVTIGVAGADHGQLVGMLADARKVIGDQQPALAPRLELPPGRSQDTPSCGCPSW